MASREAECLRELLADMALYGKPAPPVSLHYDNLASIVVAKIKVYNVKRRHIRLRDKIMRNLIRNGIISLDYVNLERNFANPITKGLCKRMIIKTLR